MVIFADLLISTWNLFKCWATASKNDNKVWLSSFYFTECPITLKLRNRSELSWVKQQYFSFSVLTSEFRLTQSVSRSENRAQLGVWFPAKKVLNLWLISEIFVSTFIITTIEIYLKHSVIGLKHAMFYPLDTRRKSSWPKLRKPFLTRKG